VSHPSRATRSSRPAVRRSLAVAALVVLAGVLAVGAGIALGLPLILVNAVGLGAGSLVLVAVDRPSSRAAHAGEAVVTNVDGVLAH